MGYKVALPSWAKISLQAAAVVTTAATGPLAGKSMGKGRPPKDIHKFACSMQDSFLDADESGLFFHNDRSIITKQSIQRAVNKLKETLGKASLPASERREQEDDRKNLQIMIDAINVGRLRGSGAGWQVKVVGDMEDLLKFRATEPISHMRLPPWLGKFYLSQIAATSPQKIQTQLRSDALTEIGFQTGWEAIQSRFVQDSAPSVCRFCFERILR